MATPLCGKHSTKSLGPIFGCQQRLNPGLPSVTSVQTRERPMSALDHSVTRVRSSGLLRQRPTFHCPSGQTTLLSYASVSRALNAPEHGVFPDWLWLNPPAPLFRDKWVVCCCLACFPKVNSSITTFSRRRIFRASAAPVIDCGPMELPRPQPVWREPEPAFNQS